MFSPNPDARDERPPVYTMRLLTPLNNKDRPKFGSKTSIWHLSELVTSGHVSGLPRLRTRDMVEIEALDETLLPETTEPDTHMGAAEKYQQLGTDAIMAIMKSLLTPLNLGQGQRKAMLFLDCTVQTGDSLTAFLRCRSSLEIPTFYMGVARTVSTRSGQLSLSKTGARMSSSQAKIACSMR